MSEQQMIRCVDCGGWFTQAGLARHHCPAYAAVDMAKIEAEVVTYLTDGTKVYHHATEQLDK